MVLAQTSITRRISMMEDDFYYDIPISESVMSSPCSSVLLNEFLGTNPMAIKARSTAPTSPSPATSSITSSSSSSSSLSRSASLSLSSDLSLPISSSITNGGFFLREQAAEHEHIWAYVHLPDEIILYIMEIIRASASSPSLLSSSPYSPLSSSQSSYVSNLKSFSLVCRQWRTCAQHVLFEKWILDLEKLRELEENQRGQSVNNIHSVSGMDLGSGSAPSTSDENGIERDSTLLLSSTSESRDPILNLLNNFLISIGPHIRFLKLDLTKRKMGINRGNSSQCGFSDDLGYLRLMGEARSMFPGFWKENGESATSHLDSESDLSGFLFAGNFNNELEGIPVSLTNLLPNAREIYVTPPGHEGRDLEEILERFPGVVWRILGRSGRAGMSPSSSRHGDPTQHLTTTTVTTTSDPSLKKVTRITLELPVYFYGMGVLRGRLEGLGKGKDSKEDLYTVEREWRKLDSFLTPGSFESSLGSAEGHDGGDGGIELVIGVRVRNVLGVLERCETCAIPDTRSEPSYTDNSEKSESDGVGDDGIDQSPRNSGNGNGFCKVYPRHMEESVLGEVRALVERWMPGLMRFTNGEVGNRKETPGVRLEFVCLDASGKAR